MTANNTSAVDLEELADLCRVCLQLPENALDLTTIYDEDDNLTYGECFTICTQIDLSEGDNLPRNLCKSCGLELQMTYDFYKKVEESKRSLQQYHQQIGDDRYALDEGVRAKHKEGGEQPTTQQNEQSSFVDSSEFIVTDQIDQQAGLFVETDKMYQHLNVEDHEQFITMPKNDVPTKIIIDVNSLVGDADDDDDDDDDTTNGERLTPSDDCLVLEEHLDIDEFNNVEALDDEVTETLQIKSSRNSIPMQILKIETTDKFFFDEDVDSIPYHTVTAEDDEEESQQEPHQNKDDSRSWQENVVAVANKEHLPLEAENDDSRVAMSELDYEVIQSGTDDEVVDVIDHDKANGPGGVGQSRKRHVGSYTCDYCLKVYPNYSRMMTHRRCHETDRPKYPCIYCSRIYATKQAMECHVQTVHDKTGFACSICNKVFAIRRSLEVHMRFHNGDFPYACSLCDKKFAQLCHLNTHKNVKHNNVRFGCDYPNCGKFFTSSTSLRNHEYTHGIMPFECEYCQRGYPAKAKLKIHIKRKHGMDLTKEQLENMRKFHVMRSKVKLVKVVPIEQEA